MAATSKASSATGAVELYNRKARFQIDRKSYFTKFMGGPEAMVWKQNKIGAGIGHKMNFTLISTLTGAGKTEGQVLKGNEEAMNDYNFSITLARYSHAVKVEEEVLFNARAPFKVSDAVSNRLTTWAAKKRDDLCFDALKASPTLNFYRTSSGVSWTATAATAKAALTTTDSKLQPKLMTWINTWVTTGGQFGQPPFEPLMVDGIPTYVLLVHPDSGEDLTEDSTYHQAMREAYERGKKNPLFTGALLAYRGLIVHTHPSVPIGTDAGAGSNVPYTQGFLLGQQALCYGEGAPGRFVEETDDYGVHKGTAYHMWNAVGKSKFNSKDFACANVWMARTQISDSTAS